MTETEMNDAGDRGAQALSHGQDIPKDADRLARISARVRDGAYSTDAILRATARVILERRDV